MGATIFEKHIALEGQKKGFDIKFSLKGSEIKRFKNELVNANKILGRESFIRKKNEMDNLKYRRSIYAIKDIKKGEKFTDKNIKTIRPAYGLNPNYYFKILQTVFSSFFQILHITSFIPSKMRVTCPNFTKFTPLLTFCTKF